MAKRPLRTRACYRLHAWMSVGMNMPACLSTELPAIAFQEQGSKSIHMDQIQQKLSSTVGLVYVCAISIVDDNLNYKLIAVGTTGTYTIPFGQ